MTPKELLTVVVEWESGTGVRLIIRDFNFDYDLVDIDDDEGWGWKLTSHDGRECYEVEFTGKEPGEAQA